MAMAQALEKGHSKMAPMDQMSINLHHTTWFACGLDSAGLSLLLPGPLILSLPGRWKCGPSSVLVRWPLMPTLCLLGDSRRTTGGSR